MHHIKLVVPLGVSRRIHSGLAQAIASWLNVCEASDLTQPIHISVRGGAYLSAEEVVELWRELLPDGLAAHVRINGQPLIAAPSQEQRPRPKTDHGREQ
jgi:hypothetical protein